MHEYSIVQALVERVEREARARGATAVHRLSVRIGDLAGVEAGLLASAYEICREGTLCAEAELAIESVPARWACPDCGQRSRRARCCAARSAGARPGCVSGDEIILDRIEMEVA